MEHDMDNKEVHHPQETKRLKTLKDLQILDTPIEERFERITRLAKKTFGVPICAISCIDSHRQWYKSAQGMCTVQTSRCVSFCQHTILESDALVINDARTDDRFANSPLVKSDNGVVFYAGVPIYARNSMPVAAFCIIDQEPREFNDEQLATLKDFAKMVEYELTNAAPNPVENRLVEEVGESWRASLVDPLTRLWNHEGIATVLDQTLSLSRDARQGVSIALIDLHNFSEINDEFGHVSGDDILRWLSKDLLKEVPEEDVLGRMSGDTYAYIKRHQEPKSFTNEVLNTLQEFFNAYPIPEIGDRTTLGATIADLYIAGNWEGTVDDVFDILSDAMFEAKQLRPHQSMSTSPYTHEIEDPPTDQRAA